MLRVRSRPVQTVPTLCLPALLYPHTIRTWQGELSRIQGTPTAGYPWGPRSLPPLGW